MIGLPFDIQWVSKGVPPIATVLVCQVGFYLQLLN